MRVPGYGRPDSTVMIVGEAPGKEEEAVGVPFVGQSGQLLDQMLLEAGISRIHCYTTNVCKFRPPGNEIDQWICRTKKDIPPDFVECAGYHVHPYVKEGYDELQREIVTVSPKCIIALGNTPFWALCGKEGITKWRGSQLTTTPPDALGYHAVPTFHPAGILRGQWANKFLAVQDMRRVRTEYLDTPFREPEWNFLIRPGFSEVQGILETLLCRLSAGPVRLAIDIETANGVIACLGLAWSNSDAICIPFLSHERGGFYWGSAQELDIVLLLRQVLSHPNLWGIGQNFLYDAQYLCRWWRVRTTLRHDTMTAWHVLYAGLSKALHFQASLLCKYYRFWKEDGKELDKKRGDTDEWTYNCTDAIRTFECAEMQMALLLDAGLVDQNVERQNTFPAALDTVLRGFRYDLAKTPEIGAALKEIEEDCAQYYRDVLGHDLNPRSPVQMKALFYEDFREKPIRKVAKGRWGKESAVTLDDEALDKIAERTLLLRPLVRKIQEHRSVGVFRATFVEAEVDWDGRMRCSINKDIPETYRWSTSQNAFGSGMNLQNIPTEGSKAANKARLRGSVIRFPDVRKLFLPDPGYTLGNADLDRADLQVVTWEADDEELKTALKEGIDLHLLNAQALFDLPYIREDLRDPSLIKLIRSKYGVQREFCKTFIHGTNYGGKPPTMAEHSQCSVGEAVTFQARWFKRHPGILDWHRRTEDDLSKYRRVHNQFGYRRIYFDRVDQLLPEALAWKPQSTVALIIEKGFRNIYEKLPTVQLLIQVHDSIVFQYPTGHDELLDGVRECMRIEVPYPDPLIIPVSIKTSQVSWGDC